MDMKIGRPNETGWLDFANHMKWLSFKKKGTTVQKKDRRILEISRKERDSSIFRNKNQDIDDKKLPLLEFPEAKEPELLTIEESEFGSSSEAISGIAKRSKQKHAAMKTLLKQISEKNEELERLSQKTKENSENASTLQKEASELEYKAKMNEILSGTVDGLVKASIATAAAMLIVPATGAAVASGMMARFFAKFTNPAFQFVSNLISINVNAPVNAALEWFRGYPKWNAATKTKEAQTAQADVQLAKDEQSIILQEISILQNMFSMESQAFSVFISILQTVISALNDAKKAIASGMSR